MPLCQEDVERSLRILYEVRNLNNNSSNDEEKVAIDQAISILEAHKSSGALSKSPTPSASENGPSQEFWSRYASARQSPVVEEGRSICVLEFASVPADGLGLELGYGDESATRSPSPNGFHTPRPIVVESIATDGVAGLDGRLQPGDQVLEVNRHTLVRVTLERAKWLLDSAVRQGRVLLAIAEKPGAPNQPHPQHQHQRRGERSSEPTLTAYNKRGSLISDLIVHGDFHHGEGSPSTGAIAEEGESGTLPADMSRRQISRKEARLMRERSLTLPTPTKSESRRLKHAGGFKKRDVRLMHMVNSVPGGLGLEITGGKGSSFGDTGIYISHVKHAGIADRMGKLRRGDEILMVNGRSMIGLSHAEAQQYLHGLPPGAMQVVIAQVPEAWQDTSSNVFMSPEHTSSRPSATNGERSPSAQTHSPHRVQPVARTTNALVDQWQMKSPMKTAVSRSQSLSSTSSEDAMHQVRAGPKRISSGDLGEIGALKKERSSLSLRGRAKSFEHVAKSRVHPMTPGQANLSASKDSLSGSSQSGQPPSPGKLSEMNRLTRVLSAPNVATENTPQEPSLRQEVLTKDRSNSSNAQSLTHLVQFPNTDLVPITPWARFTKPGSVRKAAKKQEETIVLVKDGRGLGFTIVGGRGTQRGDLPIIVKTITSEGAASEDGRLQVGDELITINGQSLEGATQAQAKQIFKNVKRGVVTLEVRHRQRKTYREITITLTKEPGVGLGFSIGGVSTGAGPCGRDKYDIYIQFLQEGTAAAKDGQATRGDQIVSVNGTSLEAVVLDDAHTCFQTLTPGPVDIVLRRRMEKVDAETQRKQSFSAAAGQRTNSFHESARRLEKAKVSSVTVVSDSKGNTLSTERSARRPSTDIDPYLAGTGLHGPSRGSVSPLGQAPGVGRRTPDEGEASAKPAVVTTATTATAPPAMPEKPKASDQAAEAVENDLSEQHLKQSSSLMASLSDYFNQSFSSRENSPATQRQTSTPTTAAAIAAATANVSPEKRLSMHAQTEEITLSKDGSPVGLGMTIMGGSDTTFGLIIVTDVNKAGPAFGAGIEMGDELVEVNGLALAGMSSAAVIDLLRETRSSVRLLVGKAVSKTPKSKARSPSNVVDPSVPTLVSTPGQPAATASTPVSSRAETTTDGGKDAPSSPPPALPEVSPVPSTPGSRAPSFVASSQQSSPAAGRVIHRRSLSSIGPQGSTAAPTSNPDLHERRSDSDDSGSNDVSIVPMVTRQSRKRTRTTRPVRSGFADHHDSSESVRSGAKSPALATPTKNAEPSSSAVAEDLVPVMPSSPPPILPPSSYTSAMNLVGSPLSDMMMSNESLSEPVAAPAVATPVASSSPVRPPSPAQYRRSPNLTKKSPSLPSAARSSPKTPKKTSHGLPPTGAKPATPPPVAPYRPSTPPTPTKTPESVRKASFNSPLAVVFGKTDSPSPKTPRKSSLSRMKSSPLPSRGSPKRSAPSPEMTSYTTVNESSEYGSITFGKRSETGFFELQLRKSIAGLGIYTQTSRGGTVLVKSAPSGKGADLRAGDQLVKVNGQDVSGMTSAEADSLLKSLPRGKVTLLVRPSALVSSSQPAANGVANGMANGVANGNALSPVANDDSISATSSGLGTSVSTLESSSLDSNKLVSPSSPPDPHRKRSSLADDSKPSSVIHRDPEEGVINIELEQESGETLGLVIEGGVETSLQYIFVRDIEPNSSAQRNGRLRRGDQIIMFNEDCLVGMDFAMATQVVMAAKTSPKIDFVVSRKKAEEKPVKKPPPPTGPSTTVVVEAASPPAAATTTSPQMPSTTNARRPSVKPASHNTQQSAAPTEPPKPLPTADSAVEKSPTGGTLLLQAAIESEATEASAATPTEKEGVDEVDGGVASDLAEPMPPKKEEKAYATNLRNTQDSEAENANRGRNVKEETPVTNGKSNAAKEAERKADTEANSPPATPLIVVAKEPEEKPLADTAPTSRAEKIPDVPKPATPTLEKVSQVASVPQRSPRPLSRVKDGREGSSSPTTAHGSERISVHLKKAGGPLGLAIVGGVDTDIGSILIKRIVANSAAGRSQLLQTGDCLLSVNGKSVEQSTYAQALAMLKAAPDDVTLVVTRRKQATAAPLKSRRGSTMRRTVKRQDSRNFDSSQVTLNDEQGYNAMGSGETIDRHGSDEDFDRISMSSTTSERRTRRKMGLSPQSSTNAMSMTMARRAGIQMADVKALELVKGNSGLGFSVAGGKGTPQNGPVQVKTVFEGGPAERSKEVFSGDVLIEVNGKDFTAITRRDAVDFLKAIPAGPVRMLICSKGKAK